MPFRHRKESKALSLSKLLESQNITFDGLPETEFRYDEAAERFTLSGSTFVEAENRIQQLEKEVSELLTERTEMERLISDLEGRVCHKFTEVQYDRMINSLEAEIQALRINLNSLREENAFEEKRVLQAAIDAQKFAETLKATKETEDILKRELEQRKSAEKLLERQMREQVSAFSEQVEKMQQDRNMAIIEEESELDDNRSAADTSEERAKSAENALLTSERRVSELEAACAYLQAENERLKSENCKPFSRIVNMEHEYDHISILVKDADEIRKALNQLRDSCYNGIECASAELERLSEILERQWVSYQ